MEFEWIEPHTEVVSSIGSGGNPQHFSGFVEAGDYTRFQIQATGVSHLHDFAGGEFHHAVTIRAWLFTHAIPTEVARQAKLLDQLSNNPTGALATLDF